VEICVEWVSEFEIGIHETISYEAVRETEGVIFETQDQSIEDGSRGT
jgi:hypothetical protein